MLISFIILTVKVGPHWPSVFKGFLPSKTLVEPSGLYACKNRILVFPTVF